MSKNILVGTVLVAVCLCGIAAADPNCSETYTMQAKQELLSGTLSGVREAYYILDKGMQESICAGDRELTFLHAATKTAMLCIENGDANNFINIANDFGVTVVGDYFAELKVNVLKSGNCYEIPAWAPDANEVSQRIQNSIIPEINDIIAELNSISDSPTDRFEILFGPSETGLDKTVIVDYGEVLILQGMLAALKSQLEFRQAYNLAIDTNDPKVEELINSTFCGEEPNVKFNINGDFLERYVNLLKVLPDGNSVLAQSKQDLITAINYYFTCINYIISEANDQHLLYIDPNDVAETLFLNTQLGAFRDSLKNDTAATYPLEITKTYRVYHNSAPVGQLVLVYEPFDEVRINVEHKDKETLTFDNNTVTPPWETWEVYNFDGSRIELEIDFDIQGSSPTEWREGYFDGTLSSDGNNITNGELNYYYWAEQCCPLLCGNWESPDSNDGWGPVSWDTSNAILTPASTTGVTLGSGSLGVQWTGKYWTIMWNAPSLDELPTSLAGYTLMFDLTALPTDFADGNTWVRVADKIALNSDVNQSGPGSGGWKEWTTATAVNRKGKKKTDVLAGLDWQASDGASRTYSLVISDYDLTNATWFQIIISAQLALNGNETGTGKFYLDNARLIPPDLTGVVTVSGLSATLIGTHTVYGRLDPNPVFGGSSRYPNPVNPRDLLPAFDANNRPISCTFGHGLNNDATLGGILPDMNQQDWSNIYGLSDCGNTNCPSADVASAQGAGIGDCLVNIYDLAALASHWLDVCAQPSWCGNVDFDRDGSVDFTDFATLANEWLQQGGY